VREGAPEDQAPRLDADDEVDLVAAGPLDEPGEGRPAGVRVEQQRGDVLEHDPRAGKVRDVANMVAEVHAATLPGYRHCPSER
jgi:hypothetical protein